MSTSPDDRDGCRISIVDEDPLRARRDARELLLAVQSADPGAALDIARDGGAARGTGSREVVKGGPGAETVGLVLGAASLVTALVQTWLARVPQRTIVVRRRDGATLHLTGREARADDDRIERFLAGDGGTDPNPGPEPGPDPDDGTTTTAAG